MLLDSCLLVVCEDVSFSAVMCFVKRIIATGFKNQLVAGLVLEHAVDAAITVRSLSSDATQV